LDRTRGKRIPLNTSLDFTWIMGRQRNRRALRLSFLSSDAEIVDPTASEVLARTQAVPAWDGGTICPVEGDFPRAHITWHAGSGFNFHCFVDENSLGHFLVSNDRLSPTAVEINLGGEALERWPRELFVPESLAAEALKYFLEHRRLKPSLSWTGTAEFPRESIWRGRKEREAWEQRNLDERDL
jgi:hypothetical protein